MRKVYLSLVVNVIVVMDENTSIDEVKENLFVGSDADHIDVEDSEIISCNVTDVK